MIRTSSFAIQLVCRGLVKGCSAYAGMSQAYSSALGEHDRCDAVSCFDRGLGAAPGDMPGGVVARRHGQAARDERPCGACRVAHVGVEEYGEVCGRDGNIFRSRQRKQHRFYIARGLGDPARQAGWQLCQRVGPHSAHPVRSDAHMLYPLSGKTQCCCVAVITATCIRVTVMSVALLACC